MLKIAYLANEFPSPVEPYVVDEIAELRRRGVCVLAGSVARARDGLKESPPGIVLLPLRGTVLAQAVWLCIKRWKLIRDLIGRVLLHGNESLWRRLKALVHTLLGACYAVMLQEHEVEYIHVHHGYFASWIAMIAARLLGVSFSMTLHGSDLLLHRAYLQVKLANCSRCVTVSEYNRRYILQHYPEIAPEKVEVIRLGVEVSDCLSEQKQTIASHPFTVLVVGRLHKVKNHDFLVRACANLLERNVDFNCLIAGEGPERRALERLIEKCDLEERVTLLGHVPREQMSSLYNRADLVMLTSYSEGIPLVLMEAMALGKIVLAPAITGIPELVKSGKTGYLYEPESMDDLVAHLLMIERLVHAQKRSQQTGDRSKCPGVRHLDWIRHAARVQVHHNFHRKKNLDVFADLFVQGIRPPEERLPDENLVLQQI